MTIIQLRRFLETCSDESILKIQPGQGQPSREVKSIIIRSDDQVILSARED